MSLDIYKRIKTENSYSPLFSPISTHSSHNVQPPSLSLFNPKRTMSSSYLNTSPAAGIYVLPQRAISLDAHRLQQTKLGEDGGRGQFLKDITNTLVDTGKFFWHKLLRNGEYQNDHEVQTDKKITTPGNTNKRKMGDLSDYYLIPRKHRKISRGNEAIPAIEKSRFTSEGSDGSLHRAYDTLSFSKDPFNWNDWKTDVIKPKDNENSNVSNFYPRYGTSFARRSKLARQSTNKKQPLGTQWDELGYLRTVFNGEYTVPKMIQDERENQLKMLQKDKNNTIKVRKYIVDLTERIKNIILEKSNEEKENKDDDLVILKEQRVSTLEKKRKEHQSRCQRFDQSKVDFEGEFKMYRQLLDERKHIQEEVRKKKESSKKKKLVPSIGQQDINQVEKNLRRQDNAVLTNKDNIEVTTRDFRTLAPRRWLNDTVIEFFMHFIERETPRSVAFNSYFYTNLSERGYQGVRRWMRRKKVQIGDLEKIFVPVNLNESHWALGMIDIPSKSIYYVDSLSNGPNALSFAILNDLQNYVIEESKNTMGSDFMLKNLSCPQQPNGFDCGIYLCLNTLYLSHESPLTFDHNDAVRMRQYIAHLILLQGSK
ncbi:hypothetical protein ZYGR_0S00660 [Zygosaccharomyces rouxii]|uniref:ZYRO0F03916p n=2 Tax=Zygosaccharomyces rouxii TaxID=4956 RepID=C5DXC5_ZYGRC|nr:uncharacterized protein ZYRO0F03916g [Zygosaccharomyces rouxii]KAH9199199.1 hypothetical protein LQ764DRAFT_126900 [Zygosaccharomyces rouxii]GAV49933.1 hypothetical protein ZYGR_0S00660 [Zygosaccharomyces rouxii]CAR28436.1 ZYRO0F03916p [Zygosaccharomyces rouxii]